ncbi:MAG: hypothetical protein AAF604_06190 [Acidobacteriota bacterium]
MKKFLLAVLALSALVLTLTMVLGGQVAGYVFGALAVLFPVPLMALGALRRGRLGRSAWGLMALALLLGAGFAGMAVLAGHLAEAPWVAGLPLATVWFLVSVWLAPLVLVSLVYALTFDEHGVDDATLERLRALRRRES